MNEIDKANLTDQTKFRLNEMSKIENYFNSEINQRKNASKKLSKYVSAFDYIDKIFIVLSATAGGVCIISHATVDMEISREEFITILKDKDKYEKMKENVRNLSEKLEEKQENARINNLNSSFKKINE